MIFLSFKGILNRLASPTSTAAPCCVLLPPPRAEPSHHLQPGSNATASTEPSLSSATLPPLHASQ